MAYSIKKLESGVLLFTIQREDKRNAINSEVMDGLQKLLETALEEEIKAVAITGSGEQAFCSGGDLSEFHLLKSKTEAYPMLSKMSGILYSIMTLPKPTLAILNGTAVGGGCEIAASCDFRIARKGIKAGFIQGRQGIITGWGGGSILAEKLPGPFSMRMLMEAELMDAEMLLQQGFLNWIYGEEVTSPAESFLGNMLAKEAGVLSGYKSLWIKKWESSNLRTRIEEEVDNCSTLWESDVHHLKVAKFLNKKS